MARILFLPGAGASASFWRPVGDLLPQSWPKHFFAWPGLGDEPADPSINGIDDLVGMVCDQLDQPADIVAQSMGGLVALKAVLQRPEKVSRLVLTGTSGGVPVEALGGADWRTEYRREYPGAASWITELREDLSGALPTISAPTLLLWGDRDQISPVAVGERLRDLLPDATLRVIAGGQHDFPQTHSAEVAAPIQQHLAAMS